MGNVIKFSKTTRQYQHTSTFEIYKGNFRVVSQRLEYARGPAVINSTEGPWDRNVAGHVYVCVLAKSTSHEVPQTDLKEREVPWLECRDPKGMVCRRTQPTVSRPQVSKLGPGGNARQNGKAFQ